MVSTKTSTKPIILNLKIENNLASKNIDECCDLEAQQKKKTAGLRLPPNKNQLSYGHGTQIYSDPFGGLNYNEIRRINDQGQTMYQTLSRDMQNYYQDVQRQQNNFNQMLNNLVNQPMPQIAAPIQQAPQPQPQIQQVIPPPLPTPQVIPLPQPPTPQPQPPPPPPLTVTGTPIQAPPPPLTVTGTPIQAPTPATTAPVTPQQLTFMATPTATPAPTAPPTPPPRNPDVAPAMILANLPQEFSNVYRSFSLQNDKKTFNGFLESFNGKNFIQKKTADRLGLYPLIELALSRGLITNDKNRLLYSRYLNEYQNEQSMAAAGPVFNPLTPP